jgi:alkylhydroperoxidase/carboxymuconolactone decarboxylase family protein YurZ
MQSTPEHATADVLRGLATADVLRGLASGDESVLEGLAGLRLASRETSALDPRSSALVRIAALVALGAPPASYAWQVEAAGDAGVTPAEMLGVLVAVTSQVGATRVVAAAGEIAFLLGLERDIEARTAANRQPGDPRA